MKKVAQKTQVREVAFDALAKPFDLSLHGTARYFVMQVSKKIARRRGERFTLQPVRASLYCE